ncbi:uncharacterized protein BDZ99DRAFT_565552 [Mytilinidion resinicola]|uniref:Ca2+ regulator and membrane fusion protein Fig1-domain-containing protein n=1 Tax=Mytilinidion resinicola TaxID=574789 RepID=A0A6A6Z5U8_9PEZI|nr:uncharacterized protein BDZ99DRAFT_565552 [Mytilinidion resinicola]KAF2815585.1 hypothetical protein BDZ99DRAFT_565552 [Mytilinidion resinicola]
MGLDSVHNRMQNINYRLWVYLLPIPIILFYGLSLTRCVSNSPGIGNIFAVKLQPRNSTTSITELRVNYFGICASVSDHSICQSSSGKTADRVLQFIFNGNLSSSDVSDSKELVSFALTVQSKIILYLLAVAGILLVIGLLLVLLLKRHFKAAQTGKMNAESRRQSLRRATLTAIWTSVGLALASALTVSQVTAAMEYITKVESVSTIQITAGTALSVLQWFIFSLSALFAAGISSIFKKQGGFIELAGSAAQGMSAGVGMKAMPPLTGLPPPVSSLPPPVMSLPPPVSLPPPPPPPGRP